MAKLAGVSVLIAVIGPGWLGVDDAGHRRIDEPDDYVREEISLALKIGIPVVPELVGTADMPKATTLPDSIRDLAFCQYLRFDGRTTRDDSARVVDAVVRIVEPSASPQGGEESAPTAAAKVPRAVLAVCAEPDSDRRGSQDNGVGRLVLDALLDIGIAGNSIVDRSHAEGSLLQVPSTDAPAVASKLVGALSNRLAELDRPWRWRAARLCIGQPRRA